MAPPDAGASPDVDSSAGLSGGESDTGGGESQDPTLADMDAIMSAEAEVDGAAGFEIVDSPMKLGGPDIKPATEDKKPAPAAAAKPDAEAQKPTEPPADEPAPELPAPPLANAAAEAVRLRKGFAKLAQERQAVVAKTNEANAAIERAKTFEASHKTLQDLPARIKADPLAFLAELGIDSMALMDRVIETEKSPVERRMEKLERELAAERETAAKAQVEREARDKEARDAKTVADWRERNVTAAAADPEKFDLILSLGQEEVVHETCLNYLQTHGKILDPVIAAEYVEKNLRQQVQKSKFAKSLGQSTPAAPAAKPVVANAQRSNGTPAPKHTGPTTLAGVASGDSAPSAAEYPEDDEARMAAVLREMKSSNELPDHFQM